MNLKQFETKSHYNLFVTFDNTAWDFDKYEVDKSRFLAYTNVEIRDKFIPLNCKSLDKIKSFPCLFLYELDTGKRFGYVGQITKIMVRDKAIRVYFEKFNSVSIQDIMELSFELDISMPYRGITELNRTHWAIKNVNLIQELRDSNVLPTPQKPKVFISYSWGSDKTKRKVKHLAKKLEANNIEVIYDKKSLRLGNDMIHFMERLENDPSIEKVLLICDESYTIKSNSRKSGVGIETKIIASSVYNNPNQNKFIPILIEKDENDTPFTPTFLRGILGVDFTFGFDEEEFQRLLENIFT